MKMRHILVRRELEKRFTHVTFVRTVFEGERYEYSIWWVNDEMEEIVIRKEWKVEEILTILELKKLKNVDHHSDKYSLFYKLMKEGKIELDHTLYKKTTLKKLEKIAEQ